MLCPRNHFLNIALLASSIAYAADATTPVTPHLSYRSQSQNLARQMCGTANRTYKADVDMHNVYMATTPEYTRTFNGDTIFRSLFGCYYPQACKTLNITGLNSATRGPKDLAADWFYLASDYQGSICFDPVIQNFNADIDIFWGMDAWIDGLFLRIHAPLTWTKWNLGAKFTTTFPGNTSTIYLNDAEKFFCSKGTEKALGLVTQPLSCARFCGCSCDDAKTKTRLADIQTDFGWNFLINENYHLGVFARLVSPTGNRVKGEWLFEPIVGNGHHWELGGGLTSSVTIWRNKEDNKHLGFYLDANVTHLFNTKQNRVFDLKNNPLSRYMRTFKLEPSTYSVVGNLTSCAMNISVAVQADIAAMINFTCKSWSYDLGYNFWVRSCEKFDCSSCDTCENECTSCCGQCTIKKGNTENWLILPEETIHGYAEGDAFKLTESMIDYDSARTKGMSNKLFGHIAYTWMDNEKAPFVGLGSEIEFGKNDTCCTNTTCENASCCTRVALSQWALLLSGGCSF